MQCNPLSSFHSNCLSLVRGKTQDYLEYRSFSYERLDGSVRAEERFDAVRSFSADHSRRGGASKPGSAFVFLLTTRAGGVGLNLVAADTVSSLAASKVLFL